MNGKFFVMNIHAALKDKTDTWVKLPEGTEVDIAFEVTKHSHVYEEFEGQVYECDDEAPKQVDVFSKMCNYNNASNLGDKQAEEYFCSKTCLLKWFESILEKLPNP